MTESNENAVFVSGIFNVLHPGHVRLLGLIKKSFDRLVALVPLNRMAGDVDFMDQNGEWGAIQISRWVDRLFNTRNSITKRIRCGCLAVVVVGVSTFFGKTDGLRESAHPRLTSSLALTIA